MAPCEDCLEITGDQVVHRINGISSKTFPVSKMVESIKRFGGDSWPDIMPEGVKFFRRRGAFTTVAIEQNAGPRSVYFISQQSAQAYGDGVTSQKRYLSFPYTILLACFHGLTLYTIQAFYRREPLTSLKDELLQCNLLNVSVKSPGLKKLPYWFCTQYLGDLSDLSWNDKIKYIIRYLWGTGFNWSSDVHEGASMFTLLKKLDSRIANFDEWEKQSKKEPYFALTVKWSSAGLSLDKAIDQLFEFAGAKNEPLDCKSLVDLLALPKDLAHFRSRKP